MKKETQTAINGENKYQDRKEEEMRKRGEGRNGGECL